MPILYNIIFTFLFIASTVVVDSSHAQKRDTLEVILEMSKSPFLQEKQQHEQIDLLIREAKKRGDDKYLCQAYLQKIILSYNSYDYHEITKWFELLEPLALESQQYEPYFRGKQCFIDIMLLDGHLENGEIEARKMLEQAMSWNNQHGIVVSHLCLSHAYTMSLRDLLAVKELEKAYRVVTQTDFIKLEREILHALILGYDSLDDHENHLKYLNKQSELLERHVEKHPEQKETLKSSLNLAYIMFVNYYVKIENPKLAKPYLDSAQMCFSYMSPNVYKSYYYKGGLMYYESVGDYHNALWCVDSLLEYASVNSDFYIFQTSKARILWKSGALKEAIALYESAMAQKDSRYTTVLNMQVGQVKETDDNRTMLLERERNLNLINISLLIAAIIVLIMFVLYIMHTVKVKNHLQKDEYNMRLMSQQMNSANIAKDKFLSNISHSISAPLNSIVDNSMELASNDEISHERKEELSNSVLKTTEVLMTLINNILDLSRFEAGMMKFQSETFSPLSAIQSSMRVNSGRLSLLTFNTLDVELPKYEITVDPSKFSQMLNSLLTKNTDILVKLSIENNLMQIVVKGSALASLEKTQDVVIQNEINMLFIKHFNGQYIVQPENSTIVITLPFSCRV